MPAMLAISLGITAALGGVSYGMFWPRSQLFGRVLYRGTTDAPPRVAITFDDGPHPAATPVILDTLKEMGVASTFFVIGQNVDAYPELAQRVAREGHLLANHSYHHHRRGMLRHGAYWSAEMRAADRAIEAIVGRTPTLMRPPMGFKHWYLTAAARRERKTLVTWTRRAFDTLPTSSAAIVARLAKRARPGDVLTLHDGCELGRRRDLGATVGAISPLIKALRARGLEPVRLDELLGCEAYLPLSA